MITIPTPRRASLRVRQVGSVAALTVLLALAGSPSALARPEPGDPLPNTVRIQATNGLRRIGTQYVRGDMLTGAGVPAPAWIPEWGVEPVTTAADDRPAGAQSGRPAMAGDMS